MEYSPKTDLHVLLIGPPQTGKTTLAMQFPNPWFGNTDKKLLYAVKKFPGKKFFYDYIEGPVEGQWNQLTEAVKAAAASPEVETIVIDHLTDVQRMLQDHILALSPSRTSVCGVKVMELQQWGVFATLMSRFLLFLKSTGKYVVLIAHETVDRDEMNGQFLFLPNISGQLRGSLAAYFSNVWRTEAIQVQGGTKYVVHTRPTPRSAYLGNTFNLPNPYEFEWEDFKRRAEL